MTELVAARALAGIGGGGMTTYACFSCSDVSSQAEVPKRRVASIVMSDVAPLRKRGTWQGKLVT